MKEIFNIKDYEKNIILNILLSFISIPVFFYSSLYFAEFLFSKPDISERWKGYSIIGVYLVIVLIINLIIIMKQKETIAKISFRIFISLYIEGVLL